ncbi:MAG: Kazal-type serine protease inhibitor domain-containing protein [Nanoarchaeota archaeon]
MRIWFIVLILILLISCSKNNSETGIGGTLTEKKVCNCPNTPQSVCGNDGKMYVNSCFAQCAGVGVKEGSC